MPATALTILLGLLITVGPWFHGLTGAMEQFGVQTFIYLSALLFILCCGRDLFYVQLRDPFARGWLAAILMTLFLTAISVLPFYSLMTWIRFFSHWVVYRAALLVCKDPKRKNFLLWVIVFAGIVYSIYGWLQMTGHIAADYWYSKKSMASRYVNGGHFAAFLVAPIFISLSSILTTRNFFSKALSLVIFLTLLAGLVLTRSRTVWLCAAIGFTAYLFLLTGLGFASKKLLAGLFFIFTAALAALWGSGYWIKISARFLEIWDGEHLNVFSLMHRFKFWQGSLHAILARPWGWGLGTFVHIFPQFRAQSDRFLVDYAHNETLQTGVDLGVAGIFLLYGVLWLVTRKSWRALTAGNADASSKIRLSGLLMSFLCLFTASQFDFPLRIYATSLIFAIVLAVMSAEITGLEAKTQDAVCGMGRLRWMGVTAAFLFCFTLSATQLYAQICYRSGMREEKNFDWSEAFVAYRCAIRWSPWNGDFHEALGRLSLKRAKLSFQQVTKKEHYAQALQSFQKATELNRFWPGSYFMVGTLLAQSNRVAEAERYFKKASDLEPTNAFYLSQYAYQALQDGKIQTALSLYERYQGLAFREKGPSTLQILEKIYEHTQDSLALRRVLLPVWQDQYTYGFFLAQKGNLDEAVSVLGALMKKAKQEMPADVFMANMGWQIADLYEKNKLFAEALVIYEYASEKTTDLHWRTKADEVRKLLMFSRPQQDGALGVHR